MRPPIRVGYKELKDRFRGFDDPKNLITIPLEPRPRYGNMDFNELAIVGAIARCRKPKIIFEFGRFDGLTTLCFAKSAPESQIYTLDLPDKSKKVRVSASSDRARYNIDAPKIARERWKLGKVKNRITEILMDSSEFEPTSFKRGVLVGRVDLIFIDANHEYEYVSRDTDSALEMRSKRGIIIWHDYYKRSFPGVTAFLAEFADRHRDKVFWIESPGDPDYLETSLCYNMVIQSLLKPYMRQTPQSAVSHQLQVMGELKSQMYQELVSFEFAKVD